MLRHCANIIIFLSLFLRNIIIWRGPDIRYSFVKPLVDLGGEFPANIIGSAKEYIKIIKLSYH